MSQRVSELLGQLTTEEKASLTAGADMWHGHDVERLGIPALKVSDGPAGVRGERWVATTSACAPCGTALGATWDAELLERVGRVLGEEARSKAVDIVLAPTVNLHRNPLAGRNFECFSEDPHLTAVAAGAVIDGIQSTGVGACIKHFVANDSEFQRHTISSEVTERVLREMYLVPFEVAVRRHDVVSVMSAYNRLNGTYCAQHRWLLTEVLRQEWGFDGIVMSDWWGTKADESLEAGLDLEMPGPPVHLGPTAAERVARGELDPAVLDTAAARLLTTMERLGVLDLGERPPESSVDDEGHREVLRQAAQAAIVLLRNDPVEGRPVLPLRREELRSLAVVGPNADVPAALGGGSAALNPHHVVTVLDGLRTALGPAVAVHHEPGVEAVRSLPPIDGRRLRTADGAAPGLTVEYHANRGLAGDPAVVEVCREPRLVWLGGDPADGVSGGDFSVRLRGTFVADVAGEHTFSLVTGGAGGRLVLDGEVLLDNFEDQRPGQAFFGLGSEEIRSTVVLEAGQEVDLSAEFVSYDGLPAAALLVGHHPPVAADGIERAAAAAAGADAAVVVVGLNQDAETEGEDRSTMALPGRQDELVRAVVAANPRTVVLVNAGSVVDLAGAQDAPALAQTWYLGQESGAAVADVLLGDRSPSGRLPMTYGRRVQDWPSWPNYPGEGGQVVYGEQHFMGYRGFAEAGRSPAFPFGHGLTYGEFLWGEVLPGELSVELDGDGGDDEVDAAPVLELTVPVTNTGAATAVEVVQCYVHDGTGTWRRPEHELRGFARLELAPGETSTATIALGRRAFAAWDPDQRSWRIAPGRHELRLGTSAEDVVAVVPVTVSTG